MTVCSVDFPRRKDDKLYFPVKDNDVFSHTQTYMEYVQSLKDSAPKKLGTVILPLQCRAAL